MKQKRNKRKVLVIVITVLILCIACGVYLAIFRDKTEPSVNFGFYNKEKNVEISLGMNKSEIDKKLGTGVINTLATTDNSYTYDSVELIVVYDDNGKAKSLGANSDGSNNVYSDWLAYKGVSSQMPVSELSKLLCNDYVNMGNIIYSVAFTSDNQVSKDLNDDLSYVLQIFLSDGISEQLILKYLT